MATRCEGSARSDVFCSNCRRRCRRLPLKESIETVRGRGREGSPFTDCHDAAFLFVQFRTGDHFEDGMVEIADEARVLVGRYFAQVRFNVLLHLLGRLLAHVVVTAFQARNERLQHRERECGVFE